MSVDGPNKEGSSLIEVILALGIACIAASGALGLLSATDYHTTRMRLDGCVGNQVRSLQEWMMAMPYMELMTLTQSYEGTGTCLKRGLFLEGTSVGFPWELNVRIERLQKDTPDEFTTVSPTFKWQEPSPGYPRSPNQSRTLTCPSFQRRKF